MLLPARLGLRVDDGFEREVDAEIEKEIRPDSLKASPCQCRLFTHAPREDYERRVVTARAPAGGPGANVIRTDYRADAVHRHFATEQRCLSHGRNDDDRLARQRDNSALKVSSAFAWVAENAAISAVDPRVEQVTLAPKHGGVITEFSRNMLLQASPDIESLLRMDMAKSIATGIDKAAINGGGSNEPVGILATSGIGDVPGGTAGLAPTWANILALIAAVQNANGSTRWDF